MGKLAIKLLLFALIFFIYDKLFIIVSNYSAEAEVDKRLENIIKGEINKDIIVIGSSRGARGIIAEQIESNTGFSTFNLCYPGSNIEFHEFTLRTLIKFNKSPKIILLVVDDDIELIPDIKNTTRKDRLYPLVKYAHIREEFIKLGDKDRFLSKFFVLHNLNKANFDFTKKKFSPLDTIMKCGSMPITWQKKGIDWRYETKEGDYHIANEDTTKVNTYNKIINICESNNITTVIVFPPIFKIHNKSFEKRLKQLSGDKVYYYIYNTKNPIYKNKEYYYDEGHLMKNGAIIFTNELIHFINELAENKISD